MKGKKLVAVVSLCVLACIVLGARSYAQDTTGGFSLQVTPSPLIATVDPGEQTSLEVKVRNASTTAEELKMELRAFTIDRDNGEIKISDETASNVADFVTFEQANFHVEAGQWYTQKVNVNTPKDAGFSYSFVILISRQEPLPKVEGVSNIEGSVALFTLLNVNRPDAVKKLELTSFISAKKSYEYMPAEFELSIENTGNTIVQPQGNIFIGRSADEQEPLAVLEINQGNGYIIPTSSRTLKTSWSDGFPSRNADGKLVWDWSKLNKIRIGKYTAKVVLIYDDGERDVPIESTVTFWVLPWKIIIGFVLLLVILGVGIFTVFRKSFGVIGSARAKKHSEVA